jgi:hypothetical protein
MAKKQTTGTAAVTPPVFDQNSTADERVEKMARDALKAFRAMTPGLTGFARVITGRRDVRVQPTQGGSCTDGKIIWMHVPIEMGRDRQHDRAKCDTRDAFTGIQQCSACAAREDMLATLYHEIAHIAFDSFDSLTDRDRREFVARVLKERAIPNGTDRASKVARAVEQIKPDSYPMIASMISPFLHGVVNALEDVRVNTAMYKARPGTLAMFDARAYKVFERGIYDGTEYRMWDQMPVNAQAIVGLYAKAAKYNYAGWFAEEIEQMLDDDELSNMLDGVGDLKSMAGVYTLAIPVLERVRELGFLRAPEDTEDDPEPEPEPDDEDTDGDDDEQGDESDDSDDDDDATPEQDDGGEQDDDATPDDGGEQDDATPEQDDDATPDDGGEQDDAPEQDDGGEQDDDATTPEQDDGGEQDDAPEQDDATPDDGGEQDDAPEQDDADGDSDGDSDDADDEGDQADADMTDDEDGDGADAQEQGDPGDTGDGEPDDLDDDADCDDGDSGGSTPAPGDGDADGDDDFDGDDDDDDYDDESGDPDDDATSAGDGESDGSGVGGSSPDPDTTDDSDFDDDLSADDDASGTDGADDGDDADGEQDAGMGDDDAAPVEAPDLERDGDAELVEKALRVFGGHASDEEQAEQDEHVPESDEDEDDDDEDVPDDVAEREIGRALIQGAHFDTGSRNIYGVRVHHPDRPGEHMMVHPYADDEEIDMGLAPHGSWGHIEITPRAYWDAYGITDEPIKVPEGLMAAPLLEMRRAFEANRRHNEKYDLKSGPRINGSKLGRRAATNDPRLFAKRSKPGKKDYFVVIGIDCSGSQSEGTMGPTKMAAAAQAELLHRAGVNFAVYGHTANLSEQSRTLSVDIYVIKDESQPWDDRARMRLADLGPSGGNLDGHTLEFYRKRAQESNSTDRIIMYYTDGAMPAANFSEELDVLQREVRTCEQHNITLMGVGMGTDSPSDHGLDTVQVDGLEDLPKVVRHLGNRLTGKK